jgi:V8-like Glu-specific endopeptidase
MGTNIRFPHRAVRVLVAVAGLLVAMVVAAPVPATAAGAGSDADAAGMTALRARTADGRTIDSAAEAARAAKYWTPERMRSATPADVPEVNGERGRPDALPGAGPVVLDERGRTPLAEAARELGERTGAAVSLTAVGRVFFVDPFDNVTTRYCSGSILRSNRAKMVLTAGHCVAVPDPAAPPGTRVTSQLTFVPDYPRNTTAYGAAWFVIPNRWLYESVTGYDYAITVLGAPVGVAFGGNPLVYNAPTSGLQVEALGYPGSGTTLRRCAGTTVSFPTSVHQVGLPCSQDVLNEGASGGPWLAQNPEIAGYVTGVNANYYPLDRPNVLFTPYFDDLTAEMWVYAETVLS